MVDPGGGLNQIRAEEGYQTGAALPPVPERSAFGLPFGLTLLTFDGCLGRMPDVPWGGPDAAAPGRVNLFAVLATCGLGRAALSVVFFLIERPSLCNAGASRQPKPLAETPISAHRVRK